MKLVKKALAVVLCLIVLLLSIAGCTASIGQSEAGLNTTEECRHGYIKRITREATYENEGEWLYTCRKCGHIYTEPIEKLVRKTIPTEVLDEALSNVRYNMSPFSITIGRLVNAAIDNYKIKYMTGEEAIASGYLSEGQFDSSVDIHNVYYAIISGDTMINPDIPYMTEYENEAVKVYMIFDDDGVFQEAGVILCENLQTYAILTMTTGY